MRFNRDAGSLQVDSQLAWPDGIPDVVEYGRAVLGCLAFLSSDHAREVHILRLRNMFEKAGFANSLKFALNVLTLMREAQDLNGGYWFPTPIRTVDLGNTSLILASLDTRELARHFPQTKKAGYARFLAFKENVDLPVQSLDEWVGISPTESFDGIRKKLAHSCSQLAVTLQPKHIEFFGLNYISVGRESVARVSWINDLKRAVNLGGKIYLCRSRISENFDRYFLGQFESNCLTAEALIPVDSVRLQYHLAALSRKPITILTERRDGVSALRIFSLLPRPERRLLSALASRIHSSFGKTYEFKNDEHFEIVLNYFKRLGCEVKNNV